MIARGAAVALGLAIAALPACGAPPRTAASARAIDLYHESLAHSASDAGASAPPRRDASAGALRLRADEAVAMAKKRSARLAAFTARAETAAAVVAATDTYPNPELRVSQIRLDQMIDRTPHVETALRVSPPRPGEIDAKVQAARAEEGAARAEARAEELAIEAEIRWMFDDVRLLDAEVAALEAVAATRRRLAEQLKVRLEGALATSVEDAAAALSAVEAEGDSAEQRVRRAAALDALLDRIGVAAGTEVELVGDPVTAWSLSDLPPEEVLVEAALRGRPEIEIAAARLDAAEARGSVARGKRWPWFSFLQVGYEFSPSVRQPLGWTFQTGIELPIFDTGSKGVLLSNAERAEAQRAFAAEVERVTFEVRDRLREVRAVAALLSAFQQKALPAAERASAEVARALENRQLDVLRALTIDERSVTVQVQFMRLLRRYRSALAELRRVAGGQLAQRAPGDRR